MMETQAVQADAHAAQAEAHAAAAAEQTRLLIEAIKCGIEFPPPKKNIKFQSTSGNLKNDIYFCRIPFCSTGFEF